jgi:uncharacterized repeat protein (TIGR01451 family)
MERQIDIDSEIGYTGGTRVNVDCRWWGKSLARGRVLAAGLLLLGTGCAVLRLASTSRQVIAKSVAASNNGVAALLPRAAQAGPHAPTAAAEPDQTRAHDLFHGLPLIFEPNQGQANLDPADSRAKFVARGSGYSLFLGSQGAILSMASRTHPHSEHKAAPVRVTSLEMKLAGANPNASLSATDLLPGKSNYILGNDPAKWRNGVPQYSRVRYENIYPGINLVFYGNQGRLEYDFQIAPGSDPARAELEFNGAKQLVLKDGALVIKTGDRSVRLEAPQMYQMVDGRKQSIEGSFVLRGNNRAGFAVGSYDRSRELVIDPILSFSTYFGGSGDEHATSVAVDGSFNIYIAGSTTSLNLPTSGTFQATLPGTQSVYVAKITPPLGSIVATLDYVTYLGGNGTDTPVGVKVDGAGDAFVAGTTSSTNFPVSPTAYQTAVESGSTGTTHVFVTELNPTATAPLKYSTYLSGTGTDVASGMTIDALGNVFVTGTTTSQDTATTLDQFPASTLPQAMPYQTIPRSSIQFFMTKVNTAAGGIGSIAYSTYFGGSNFQTPSPVATGGGIAVDTSGNVYFSGTTNFTYTGCSGCGSTDCPILNAYQPCLDAAPQTTVGTAQSCSPTAVTTAPDAFVAKINPNADQGRQLLWSTYVGGTATDSSTGVALDPGAANVYIVGTTNSTDIATGVTTLSTSASYQRCLDAPNVATTATCPNNLTTNDAFVARLTNPTNTTGTPVNVTLNYFSYLGGSGDEAGTAITVDSASGALITGWTQSTDFPVAPNPNSIQTTLNGTQDAFVARLNAAAVVGQTTIASWANYFGGSGIDSGTGIALDVNQNTYLAGETNSTNLQVSKPLTATNSGGYDAFVTELGTAVTLSIQGVLTLGTNQSYISAGTPATFTYTVTNNGPDLANNIVVTDNLNSNVTEVPLTFVSASSSSQSCGAASTNGTVSCTIPTLQSGSTATVVIVVTPTGNADGSSATFNGGTVQVMGPGNIVLAQTSVSATMSDFSLNVGPANQSVPAAGDTATYQVQLTPHPIFNANVTLSCSNNPANTTCAFSPSGAITLQSSSGATATFSIATVARPIVTPAAILFPRFFAGLGLLIPGLIFAAGSGGRRRRRVAGTLMLFCVLMLIVCLPACSSTKTQTPASGTPAGSYNVVVTATAGSDSKSQTVGLVVP